MWAVLVLGLASLAYAESDCPCSLDHNGLLMCADHTIESFPEDLKIHECNIQAGHVRDISLAKQPFKEIKDGAFIDFPNLEVINLAFNEIETIRRNAFLGITEIREINLKRNKISTIEEGAFDNLLKLSSLDLSDNSFLEMYETKAWHFCDRTRDGLIIEGDLDIFKNLERSETTKDYCRYVQNAPSVPICPLTDSILDCTEQTNVQEMACHINTLNFTNIILNFPVDIEPLFVENYFEAESNGFISDFNSMKGSENHTKLMENLQLFDSKFDLSSLATLTSNRTKEVIIKADTVFLTEPLIINYMLTIHARVVSINSSIGMNITKDRFFNADNLDVLEFWAPKEETFSIGRALMRRRSLGLVSIYDQLPLNDHPLASGDLCQPLFQNSSETVIDLTGWFDSTFLNLNYVVARTLQSAGSNLKLAHSIANFTLDFAFSMEDIKDTETYMAAQKFEQIKKLVERPDIHNVPSYSIKTVAELAGVMIDRMGMYRINELMQEEKLFIVLGRVEAMQLQFDIIEQQQQMYFDMELAVLESIWAATDNSWDFSFDHRNSIEDKINGAMNASQEEAFEMQEQEFKELLLHAEDNVDHMEQVVEKYQSQERRIEQLAADSLDAFKVLSQNLNDKVENMNTEVDAFADAIEEWKIGAIAEAGISAIMSLFRAVVDAYEGNFAGAVGDLTNLIEQIAEIIKQVKELIEILGELDVGDGLGGLADPIPTNFKTALQSATELVKNGPTFDEIKNMAYARMPAFEEATNNEVSSSKAMEACLNVADAGHSMAEASAQFADVMLKLADIKDEIRVATADLERSIAEVLRIKEMLDELEKHREDYENYMEEAQRQYEEEVEKMKEEYHTMSDEKREEFRANITAKFEQYQEVFKQSKADYQAQLNALIESVVEKGYGLKRHSMTQRGMIMELYIEFCDAYFYHSFSLCDSLRIPLMSDEFEVLLEKLADIKWDSITSSNNLPDVPQYFGPVSIMIEDDLDNYRYPVSTLKNQSRIDLNLMDYDKNEEFERFWRIRINQMSVILRDANGVPIPSPGTGFGEEIQSLISFPTVFNDTDFMKESHTFLCQNHFCTADYVTDGDEIHQTSSCTVDEEFSDLNYKPAADGIFTFSLPNADHLNMADVAKLEVVFGGSYIPYH